ncbi:MAG: hypothetical protein ACE5EX_10040, partial [Phycisphaerae bacterium]
MPSWWGGFAAAATVLAWSVGAYAQQPSVPVINLQTGQAVAGSDVELLPVAVFDKVPTFYSVQSPRGGGLRAGAATGVPSEGAAIVYRELRGQGFGFFLNYQPTTGAFFPGTMTADNLGLAGGFTAGKEISAYVMQAFRSSLDPNPGELADFHIELWDGDPFQVIDTPGGGYAGAPIAGSGVDFVDVPVAFAANFDSGALPKGITVSNPGLRV